MTIAELQKTFHEQLALIYDTRESRAITQLALEHILNLNGPKISLEKFRLLTTYQQQQADEMLERLQKHEPIQYIIGKTWFYGLEFFVNSTVLIPRPETEELVDWIIQVEKKRDALSILDIGTGSGCISITLKHQLPNAKVCAMDISEEALNIARNNANALKQSVQLIRGDALNDDWQKESYNIIVSNPPYISADEKEIMHKNVLQYEPHTALFAEGDALIFYRTIADKALQSLTPGGALYFEINENKGDDVIELLRVRGYKNIELKTDMSGKPRMVRAEKSN
ncbi:MAG: peptide chain release factor N(5)-glutamine methyltransferase [Chitinophagales bacterium]|nr:peptide chain release factor N(5)-glutamine methyltransferase [Chitinophagales bacterium]